MFRKRKHHLHEIAFNIYSKTFNIHVFEFKI